MLDHCGTLSNCDTCVSGPTTPDIDTCPWPPHPDVSTTTTSTTTTSSTTTTTTTTQLDGDCGDIKINEECDWNYGLVSWYENMMTANQCQIQCRSVAGAKYFSHYNEGAHGE